MQREKQGLYRRTVQIASGATALLFVVVGIAQREPILGLVWAGFGALFTWMVIAVAAAVVRSLRARRGRYAVPAEEESPQEESAPAGREQR